MKIVRALRPGLRIEQKQGQDRTGQESQKSHKVVMFPIWREAPTVLIETKICVVGNLSDRIIRAKFQDEFFGVTILQRRQISHFPINFAWAL